MGNTVAKRRDMLLQRMEGSINHSFPNWQTHPGKGAAHIEPACPLQSLGNVEICVPVYSHSEQCLVPLTHQLYCGMLWQHDIASLSMISAKSSDDAPVGLIFHQWHHQCYSHHSHGGNQGSQRWIHLHDIEGLVSGRAEAGT